MTETVLLVGGGGREHAVARSLSDSACDLYACAGNRNPGIARLAEGFRTLDATNTSAVTAYATEVDATLAVVGPEAPLEAGVADALDDAGVYAFGPRAEEARIETDKAFQRRFMERHEIPGCPDFETFDDPEAACDYVDSYDGDLAIKPAGRASASSATRSPPRRARSTSGPRGTTGSSSRSASSARSSPSRPWSPTATSA